MPMHSRPKHQEGEMAKSPARDRQLSMLLPLGKDASLDRSIKNAEARPKGSLSRSGGVRRESRRDALIERLRRDGYFDLPKK